MDKIGLIITFITFVSVIVMLGYEVNKNKKLEESNSKLKQRIEKDHSNHINVYRHLESMYKNEYKLCVSPMYLQVSISSIHGEKHIINVLESEVKKHFGLFSDKAYIDRVETDFRNGDYIFTLRVDTLLKSGPTNIKDMLIELKEREVKAVGENNIRSDRTIRPKQ